MAKKKGYLTASARKALPSKDFALPGKGEGPEGKGSGSYPIPDANHARNALARVSQHGSSQEKAEVPGYRRAQERHGETSVVFPFTRRPLMASKLYDKPRGGRDDAKPTRESDRGEPEAGKKPTGKDQEPEPMEGVRPGGGMEARHKEERATLHRGHETERRDMHGRHRQEHRDMFDRHEREHDAIDHMDHEALTKLHRKHEHEHHQMAGNHLHEMHEMQHRHHMAHHEMHARHEMEVAGGEEEGGEQKEAA